MNKNNNPQNYFLDLIHLFITSDFIGSDDGIIYDEYELKRERGDNIEPREPKKIKKR